MDDIQASGLTIPAGEITLRFSRSGGPGGQNVNKRSTKVEAVFDVAGSPSIPATRRRLALERLASRLDARGRLRVVADDARTQAANRAAAIERLADLLAMALRPPPRKRRPTKPSKGAVERRLVEKKARGELKRLRSGRDD